jgi:hypothetical protein
VLNRFNTQYAGKSCSIKNSDPMSWLIEQLNSLMLRLSISNAIEQDTNGVVSLGTTANPANVYWVNGSMNDNGQQLSQTTASFEYQTKG